MVPLMTGYTGAEVSHVHGTPFRIVHVAELNNMSFSLVPFEGLCPHQVGIEWDSRVEHVAS
jgi:hypothetical protein